jgi:hypothetical protein
VFGDHRHLAVGGGCLEVSSNSTTTNTTATNTTANATIPDGTALRIAPCDPASPLQRWGLFDAEGGAEVRHTPASDAGGMCLDVTEGVWAAGTPLQLWECQGEGHANQLFAVEALLQVAYGAAVDAITLAW